MNLVVSSILSSCTPASDIADITRAMTIKFVPVADYAFRHAVAPEQMGEARRTLWAQREAVVKRLANMLAGLLPEGATVNSRSGNCFEVVPADRPGVNSYEDRVTVELSIHEKGIGSGEYLAFEVRRGGYGRHADKTVRKALVQMSGLEHTLTTAKLDVTLGEVRDAIVQKAKLSAEMATYRYERALERAGKYEQVLAGMPSELRAQLVDRYGTGPKYFDGTDVKLNSDGTLTLETHRLTIKPELLAEFVDLLRRNDAK